MVRLGNEYVMNALPKFNQKGLLKMVCLVFLINYTEAVIMNEMLMFPEKGHRLKNACYREEYVDSSIECAHLCLSESCRCQSLNYENKEGMDDQENVKCQLNSETKASNPEHFIADPDFIYVEPKKVSNGYVLPAPTCAAKSCADLYEKGLRKDGVYSVDPDGQGDFEVRCDMSTAGGGWTIFQRRVDGSVDFFRGWNAYKNGFGDLNGEFWLGLDKINRLSNGGENVLRVDLKDFERNERYAHYKLFGVADEAHRYALSVGGYSGNAGDALNQQNGMKFSTKDEDNDMKENNCAIKVKGAWWYKGCHHVNLNGLYFSGNKEKHSDGIIWKDWKGQDYSLMEAVMKIRPF